MYVIKPFHNAPLMCAVCVCVSVCVYFHHVCTFSCAWRPEVNFWGLAQLFFTVLLSFDLASHQPWSLLIQLGWLTKEPQGSICQPRPVLAS